MYSSVAMSATVSIVCRAFKFLLCVHMNVCKNISCVFEHEYVYIYVFKSLKEHNNIINEREPNFSSHFVVSRPEVDVEESETRTAPCPPSW